MVHLDFAPLQKSAANPLQRVMRWLHGVSSRSPGTLAKFPGSAGCLGLLVVRWWLRFRPRRGPLWPNAAAPR